MPRVSEVYPDLGEFFNAEAVKKSGGNLTLTISSSMTSTLNEEDAIVLSFSNHERKLRLNKTNAATLADDFGIDESDEWTGRTLELFTAPVLYQGKKTLGMRVRGK